MSLTDHAFGVAGCTACHALRMEYTEKREKNKNVAVNFTRRNNLQPRHFSMLSVSSSESYERVRDNPRSSAKMLAKRFAWLAALAKPQAWRSAWRSLRRKRIMLIFVR